MVVGYLSTLVDYVAHENMRNWPFWVWVSVLFCSFGIGALLGIWGAFEGII